MGSHPINLGFRFLLEIAAFISLGTWGWKQGDNNYLKFALAICLPLLVAAIWGAFAVPNDPSRSGQTLVETSGIVRLVIEFLIFTVAALALFNQGQQKISYAFAFLVIIHYLISYDRIIWLLDN